MKNGSKKFYILGSIVTMILIVCVAVLIGILSIKPNKTEAATDTHYEIVVDKVSTVTVYVTGSGVSLYESEEAGGDAHSDVIHDVYRVEKGTEVTIIAVNELKVFTSWNATDLAGNTYAAVDGSTDQQKTFVPTSDVRISANRRDTTSDDVGKYMGNRFLIEGAQDLFLLQEVFKIGESVNATNFVQVLFDSTDNTKDITLKQVYDKLFAGDTKWKNYTDDQKIAAIKNVDGELSYFERLQTGYYLVNQNFAYLDKDNNMPYVGIGNATNTFNGVMCGLNDNAISTISITIQADQVANNSYYGLFGYLGANAVIRNLKVETSVGISEKNGVTSSNIYAGGLAGYSNGAFIYNVNALGRHSISVNAATPCNIYAGSLFGYMNGGIEEYANVVANGENAGWVIQTTGGRTNFYTGLVAGYASDVYVNDLLMQVSGYAATVKNDVSSANNIYMGNLFGSYNASKNDADRKLYLRNIRISGTSAEYLTALINQGNAYVAGLIGYVSSSNSITQEILIGKINFQITNKDATSKISASSLKNTSEANMYTAGLFAKVTTTYLNATDEFKQGIKQLQVEDKKYYRYDFIFNGNYYIESKNNGLCATSNGASTSGKTISGGLVGQGLFNINGTDENPSNILISSEDYKLTIKSIQTSISNGGGHTIDHCMSGLFTAYLSVNSYDYTFSNINLYASGSHVSTTRELSSTAIGDLHAGNFISYSKDTNYKNINLYINSAELRVDSLSYDAILKGIGNSAFAGGFIGQLDGDSASNKATMENVTLTGFDYNAGFNDDGSIKNPVGTKLKLTSIQNTQPGEGDYRGENYVSGMIGRSELADLTNVNYIGSTTDEDYIQMQGHQNPDSAFCGGLVGLSKNTKDSKINYTNCSVENANVYGGATVAITFTYGNDNPDIYVGGVIGAIYDDTDDNGVVTIDNCKTINSTIQGIANERVELFVGGIVGCHTWKDDAVIKNSYVYGCEITSTQQSVKDHDGDKQSAYAGGILGRNNVGTANLSNCATIDTTIVVKGDYGRTRIAGVATECIGTIENCYSNAKLSVIGSATNTIYGIGPNSNNSYYVQQNAGISTTTQGTPLDFGNKLIDGNKVDLFAVMSDIYKYPNKYYIDLEDDSIFKVNDSETSPIVTVNHDGDDNISNNAHIWININPTDSITIVDRIIVSEDFSSGNGGNRNYLTNISFTISDPSLAEDVEVQFSQSNSSGWANPTRSISGNTITYTASAYSGYRYFRIVSTTNTQFEITNISYTTTRTNGGNVINESVVEDDLNITSGVTPDQVSISGGDTPSIIFNKIEFDKTLDTYATDKERHEAGWFMLGTVLTYRGTANQSGTVQNPIVTYPTDGAEYSFNGEKFVNKFYPYNSVDNIGYTEVTPTDPDEYNGIKYNHVYTIKVRDNIPSIKIQFSVPNTTSTLTPTFFDADDEIDFSTDFGSYEFTSTLSGTNILYEFIYTPNTEIENDVEINVGFKVGTTNTYLQYGFTLDVDANTRVLQYVTYAEYTPPINYQQANIGTSTNPYLIKYGSTTKLIPVFTRINDSNGDPIYPEYNSELNVDYVTYTLSDGSVGTMKTNGELVAVTTGSTGTYYVKVRLKTETDDTNAKYVHFKFANIVSVSYSSIGAEVSGLTYANGTTPYVLEMNCLEHYGGIPKTFTVKINNTTYSTADVLANNWIKDVNGNVVTEWDVEASYYKLEIPTSYVDDATTSNGIVVTIEMQVVYTITFDLQCDTFNPNYKGNQKLVFKVLAGKEFNTFFTDAIVGATDSTDKETVNGFLNSAISTIDGYLCTGFFLVNEASSEISYGVSFNELKDTSIPINTSYTFYARWNFLIELVEAPGTSIVSRFKETFMLEINNSEYSDYVNRTIAVPINANRGYVFSVEKEAGFVGEADVKAYVISNKGSSTQTVSEISIEKYHENMYLYFIAPEKITGYLVIVTSVSNSEVIVGENTAQVTDEVLPEDGIYTFKYVVNHKNTVDENGNPVKSFIYDSGINTEKERNLDLVKDLYIQFFDQNYNTTSKKLELARKTLEPGTIVEVYYNLYINNSTTPTSASIGSYVVSGNSTSSLLLSDFKKLNNNQDFITTPQTFREFLGSNEAVSEVYYFVITPPNGYDKASNKDGYGNIDNDVVFVGYYDPGKDDALKNENYKEFDLYVQGKRTGKSFANKPIQDQQGNFEEFTNETSLQQKIYAMTPSRNTNLTLNSGTYKFEDYTQFNYIDIFMSNKAITNGIIKLEDNSTNNTIIKSGFVEYGINKLSLELGYSIGDVDIYGSYYDQDTASYKEEKVATINVDKIDYNKYEVEFGNKDKIYYYFRIDNVSLSEIRLKEIILTDQYYLREFNISADTYKEADMEDTFYKYVVKQSIVGDLRHESKQFMLALQFKNSSGTILDIDDSNPIVLNISYVDVNGNTVTATINSNLEASKGKMVVYFDLSKVLSTYNINEFTFTVGGLPTGYSVYCSQLIESSIIEKPAMGEVRVSIK